MTALGQNRSFDPGQPHIRYAPKADIQAHRVSITGLLTARPARAARLNMYAPACWPLWPDRVFLYRAVW